MHTDYTPPVSELLTLGDCRDSDEWLDYRELGLGPEHVPELITMATDASLHQGAGDSADVWAPVHAWRALGQLRAVEAIEPLLPLLHELDDSDWAAEDLPDVYGMIGAAALPALTAYMGNRARSMWARIKAAHGIERIASVNPASRGEAIAALSQQLELFAENEIETNSFLISFLIDLQAVEAAPLIERVFAAERVDLMVQGDWEDVQVRLGLKHARSTPQSYGVSLPSNLMPAPGVFKRPSSASKAAAKAKAKRKQAKAARKQNRKHK